METTKAGFICLRTIFKSFPTPCIKINRLSKTKQKKFFPENVYNSTDLFRMVAEVMKMREEENNRSSQSSFKRFMKKRWVFPAIYIASAAIILTGVLWYQAATTNNAKNKYGYKSSNLAGKKFDEPSVEVNKPIENFEMPVKDPASAVIAKKFYDFSGKKADQEAALVVYKNTYVPNTGIDIGVKDGKSFDVIASMSGMVTKVEEDSLLGNVIEVEHDDGVVTQYESVKDIKVKVGDHVKQGETIAQAGQSLFNEKAGTHVHFEIRKDGVAINPQSYFNKPLSAVVDENPAADKTSSENQSDKTSKNADQNSSKDSSTSKDQNSSKDSSTSKDQNSSKDSSTSKDQNSSKDSSTSKDQNSSKDSSTSKDQNSNKDPGTTKDQNSSKDQGTTKDQKGTDSKSTNDTKSKSTPSDSSSDTNS